MKSTKELTEEIERLKERIEEIDADTTRNHSRILRHSDRLHEAREKQDINIKGITDLYNRADSQEAKIKELEGEVENAQLERLDTVIQRQNDHFGWVHARIDDRIKALESEPKDSRGEVIKRARDALNWFMGFSTEIKRKGLRLSVGQVEDILKALSYAEEE